MQDLQNVRKLVDSAAGVVGNKSKLAKAMGVTPQKINDWYAGNCTCTPEDRARLAGFAREDALQELVRATLEKTAGTLRGEQLRQILGKSFPQIIAGVVIALLLGVSLTYGSFDAGALVAFFVLWLYSTMYIMLSYATKWIEVLLHFSRPQSRRAVNPVLTSFGRHILTGAEGL